ncbi:serine hydrolase [uncultured Robinsoniella sp.]|uniref:serine hydrolase n=1 Tax=uncultured Robinsoniella sp. TaxID=904190 RepID=UPI002913BCDE|nr:serine hydrolase [Clostridiales bacterium]
MKKFRSLLLLLLILMATTLPVTTHAAGAKPAKTGWVQMKYRYYYDKNGKKICNTTYKIDGKRYYFNAKGRMIQNRFITFKGKKLYLTSNGTAATGLKKVKGNTYLFDKNGYLRTNGFKTYNNKKYYANKKGIIQKGFHTIKGKKYYFNSKGIMQTGWLKKGKSTYYFNKKGVMQTGWQKIKKGKKTYDYYFNSNGKMAVNTWVQGYYVDKNGKLIKNKKQSITALNDELTAYINNSCTPGRWSVYVKNLNDDQTCLIGNNYYYAASVIKVFTMGAVYESIQNGRISETASINQLLHSMITYSSNESFNTLVRTIGKNATNDFCKKYGYTDTNQGQAISCSNSGEDINNGTTWNQTSVQNCGKILEDIYNGKCVSKTYSNKMLDLLKQQTFRIKIPSGLPAGTVVANKTGETDEYQHDMAIVYSPKADYILCVMSNISNAGAAQANIRAISQIVYRHFNS